MVTNLPIWLVLNAVWIFLSLHTVMVKHAQCVYNVEKINKWCKRKRKKYISYLLAGIGLSKHCNLRIENDTFFMTTKWTQLLTIQISQLANNIYTYPQYFILKHDTYQTDFRMEANGVTPIPAPIHMMTLYLNTSCKRTRLKYNHCGTCSCIEMHVLHKLNPTEINIFVIYSRNAWPSVQGQLTFYFHVSWFTKHLQCLMFQKVHLQPA